MRAAPGNFAATVVAGGFHTCALLTSGDIVCWGRNDNGQLGVGSNNDVGSKPGQMGNNLQRVNLGHGSDTLLPLF